ncbi:MAG: hypothetical protein AAF668_06550 [Pseudomonadota bacterium]
MADDSGLNNGDLNKACREQSLARPSVGFEYERYAHFLDEADLSQDQKREVLQALWNIVVGFVDLGFGVHPVQQAQKPCGKFKETPPKSALTAPPVIKSEDTSSLFESAGSKADTVREGNKP